jgi:hypothetical protein
VRVDQISTDEQELYLRNAFDAYVSTEFCITGDEALELLGQAKGNAEVVVSAFKEVAEHLQKEEYLGYKYQEDEICLSLIPAQINALLNGEADWGGHTSTAAPQNGQKRAALPPQRGQRDLRLTRRASRTRLSGEGEAQNGNSG